MVSKFGLISSADFHAECLCIGLVGNLKTHAKHMYHLYMILYNHGKPPTADEIEVAAGHKIMDPEAANTWLVELEKAMNKLADAFNRQVQHAQVCSCPSGSVFNVPSELSGIPVQPRGIWEAVGWMDCGLWSAIQRRWASRVLLPSWVHSSLTVTAHSWMPYYQTTDHEDESGYYWWN